MYTETHFNISVKTQVCVLVLLTALIPNQTMSNALLVMGKISILRQAYSLLMHAIHQNIDHKLF
jgi:hypothetical protein